MVEWRLVKLKFGRTPVHFGEVGIGLESNNDRVCSDTLFSAIVSIYARLQPNSGEIDRFLQQFPSVDNNDSLTVSPVRISSTFVYYHKQSKEIYYVPRPLKFPINYPIGEDLDFTKTYKNLTYLPLSVWRRWYQGAGFDSQDREELIAKTKGNPHGRLKDAGTFDYGEAVKTNNKVPRSSIDRDTRSTNLFHTGYTQFAWERNGNDINSVAGLYFLACFDSSDLENTFKVLLEILGDEGIGGERSSGWGRFQVEWQELPQVWKDAIAYENGTHYSLMSLLWESDRQWLQDRVANDTTANYKLLPRGGWIVSPTGIQSRRKIVRMFAEGSVFSQQPTGKLANVTPGGFNAHQIYRSGISLSLPIRQE